MDIGNLTRFCIVFFVLATTFATNLDDNLISRLGLEPSFSYVFAAALLFSLLLTERSAYLIAAVVLFSLNANMPLDFSLNMGIDRDYYAGFMFAMLVQPIMARTMELG